MTQRKSGRNGIDVIAQIRLCKPASEQSAKQTGKQRTIEDNASEKLTKFSRAQQRPRLCRRIGHDGKEQHAAEQPDPGAERGDDREILHAQPGAFHTPRAKEGCRKKAEHQHHAIGWKRQAENMKIGQHGKPSLFNKTAQPGRVAPFSLAT